MHLIPVYLQAYMHTYKIFTHFFLDFWSCVPGEGDPDEIDKQTKDNTEQGCRDRCRELGRCVAFDFLLLKVHDACRLYKDVGTPTYGHATTGSYRIFCARAFNPGNKSTSQYYKFNRHNAIPFLMFYENVNS